jgi:DNA-binding NtrC family response regulator
MTRVVVVHHDPDMADHLSDWLRHAGYTVDECAGPTHAPCPILHGRPCRAVDEADVLVYDIWATGDSGSERELIERLRELHPGTPVVLTSPGLEFDWEETAGAHAVVPLDGAPTAVSLRAAVERALASVNNGRHAPA